MVELRHLLADLESRYAPVDLKQQELDIIYVMYKVQQDSPNGIASSEAVRKSPILSDMSQPTYNRVLKRLVALGHVEKVSHQLGGYRTAQIVQNDICPDEVVEELKQELYAPLRS
jgi:DNA-binding MarR family transcriptional regulator